ncbi:MAG: DUF4127 family protein [Candidatus Melainabacteria bacterium]
MVLSPQSLPAPLLVPLDNRPVCRTLPVQLAAMAGFPLGVAPGHLLGHLKTPGPVDALTEWLLSECTDGTPLILSLDALAYGGLIASRVGNESPEELNRRVDACLNPLAGRGVPVFGFSAIMRIPHYNDAGEEPEYWATWGEALYRFSEQCHRDGREPIEWVTQIPPEVLADFKTRRARNHALNRGYLDRLANDALHALVFCQDDTGEFGLNVQEAHALIQEAGERGLSDFVRLQTGADEVACTLLTRVWMHTLDRPLTVWPVYSHEAGGQVMARFDGIPIATLIEQQITACGAVLADNADSADSWLVVHTPTGPLGPQGDHCAAAVSDPQDPEAGHAAIQPAQHLAVLETLEAAFACGRPVALADIAYANGGDPALMTLLLSRGMDWDGLYGYAGWNTPGNSVGTALAMLLTRRMAEQAETFQIDRYREMLATRLADDWLYQSTVRTALRAQHPGQLPSVAALSEAMHTGLALIRQRLKLLDYTVQLDFPCARTFEIAVSFQSLHANQPTEAAPA